MALRPLPWRNPVSALTSTSTRTRQRPKPVTKGPQPTKPRHSGRPQRPNAELSCPADRPESARLEPASSDLGACSVSGKKSWGCVPLERPSFSCLPFEDPRGVVTSLMCHPKPPRTGLADGLAEARGSKCGGGWAAGQSPPGAAQAVTQLPHARTGATSYYGPPAP